MEDSIRCVLRGLGQLLKVILFTWHRREKKSNFILECFEILRVSVGDKTSTALSDEKYYYSLHLVIITHCFTCQVNVWEDIQQIKTLDTISCFCVLTLLVHACLWKKNQEYFIMKAMKFCYISPPPQKKCLTTRPFLKKMIL